MTREWTSTLVLLLALCACGNGSRSGSNTDSVRPPSAGTSGGSSAGVAAAGPSSGGITLDTTPEGGTASGGGGAAVAKPTCDDSCAAVGKCENAVCVVAENPGNLTAEEQSALQAGGAQDSEFRWLYPYDKTVFARGVPSPELQLAGENADALYVRVTFAGFDYSGYFSVAGAPRARLSALAWTALTRAAKATDSVKVEVSERRGGMVYGPIAETWTVAQGSLRGTVYYETVASQLLNGDIGIMRLRPGDMAPQIFKAGCANACHTASADGSTLVAAGVPLFSFEGLGRSTSYDLRNDSQFLNQADDNRFVFGGLYPDGSLSMSATHYRTWPSDRAPPSRLYDTKTGAQVPAAGWDDVVNYAGIPAFSPDGTQIVFNLEDSSSGHAIAKMDFSLSQKAFNNKLELANDSTASGGLIPSGSYLGWPTFTPDGRSVIFHAGTSAQFEAAAPNTANLYRVDVATKQVTRLDAANGRPADGTQLGPEDLDLSFVPTVLPIAVGGYYWVMFTSHRSYGNTLSNAEAHAKGKLWITAVNAATGGGDSSHPPFYLEGQELEANNLRGFWVLDPCLQDRAACESGDQCCGGFCREKDGQKQCGGSPTGSCSNEYEKCEKAGDCCAARSDCINSHCATQVIVK